MTDQRSGEARLSVTVVGLGPGGQEHLGEAARLALEGADAAYLRTRRHPAAAVFPDVASFDHHYEEADTFEEVYRRIVDDLVAAARAAAERGARVVYAVPGSPLVGEATVELLRADPEVEVEVVPALSFLDLAWAALSVDPVAVSARVIDGTRFEIETAGREGPFLVAQCWSREVLSAVKLALDTDGAAPRVVVLQRLGLPDASVREVALEELDRVVEPDHLTSLWVEGLGRPVAPAMAELEELVRTLRERCPWDREQTHASLTRHLIEETYEVLDAIGEVTRASAHEQAASPLEHAVAHLEEELGDLLFQVFFHARLAAEQGWFEVGDVARGVHDKLVHRHPHVFGDVTATTAGAVVANWEAIKAAEKGRTSVTDGIPAALPALVLAAKMQRKAAAVGLRDIARGEDIDALTSALDEVTRSPNASSIGRALDALVALATLVGVDPEEALRAAALATRDRIVEHERDAG